MPQCSGLRLLEEFNVIKLRMRCRRGFGIEGRLLTQMVRRDEDAAMLPTRFKTKTTWPASLQRRRHRAEAAVGAGVPRGRCRDLPDDARQHDALLRGGGLPDAAARRHPQVLMSCLL